MTTTDDIDFCMFDLPTRERAQDDRRVASDAAAVAYTMAQCRGESRESAKRAAAEAAARAGGAR